MGASLARVSPPEPHLPEVRRLLAAELNISSHALSVIWEAELPATGGAPSCRSDSGAKACTASCSPRPMRGPTSSSQVSEAPGSAGCSRSSAKTGGLTLNRRVISRTASHFQPNRSGARGTIGSRRNPMELEEVGADFAFGVRWVCGLDEPVRRSRRRTP